MTETLEIVETTEEMRQQIEETKSHLWEKLDTLENQVSEVVQSTTTVVSETVASVQETVSNVTDTVSNVTESVQDGVQSVSNAFDLPLQVERHPWFAVGGSFVLGYLAYELLNVPTKECENESVTESQPSRSAIQARNRNGHHAIEPGQESPSKSDPLGEMRGLLTGALMSTVSAIVSRSFPTALNYLAQSFRSDPNPDPVGGGEKRRSPK